MHNSSSFLSLVIENISEGLCVCHNTDKFPYVRFTVWNKKMVELTGYTIDEINRSGWYQTVYPDPDYQEKAIKRMAEMRHGNNLRDEEWEITRADGAIRCFCISTSILEDKNNATHIMALMIDITERKQVEKELKRSKNMSETILHSMNDAVSLINADDLSIIDINTAFLDHYGFSKKDIIGRPCYEVTHNLQEPCCPPNNICPLKETVLEGRTAHAEHIHLLPDDSKNFVEITTSPIMDESGRVKQVVHIARDITKRKKAEESLRASEAELTAIIENSAAGITVSDLNGKVLRTNPAHQKIFGYDLDELKSMVFSDFTHADDVGKHSALYERLLSGEIDHFSMRKRFVHKDSHCVWAQVTVSLIRDNNKKPLFVVGIVEDITLRKLAEEEKEKLIIELQGALQEIKTLRGIIPICSYCKKIKDDMGTWDKLEIYIEEHSDADFSHGVCPDCYRKQMQEITRIKTV